MTITPLSAPPWPPVLVPTDRPRRSAAPGHCSAVTSVPRSAFGPAGDDALLAGFAAVLYRYTGQRRITVDRPDGRVRYEVTAAATLADLVADGEPGPAAPDAELRVAVRADRVELHYDARLFEPGTVSRLLEHFRTLVGDATRSPDRPVSRLRLLSATEVDRMLVRWNETDAALPHDVCLHQAFERRAAAQPGAVALVQGERRWTYTRINEAANRLAHHLRSLGVGADDRVGLCLDRSADLLIAMLGIMKAGGAYVPLDPDYPTDRIEAMVAGTSCAVMISRAALAANLPEAKCNLVLLDRDAEALSARPAHNPDVPVGPDNLCYIIHTSGSTGVPKPIALRHRGVMNNLADLNTRFGVGPQDAVLALSSPSFDMSVYEFLGATAAGGTVVVPLADRARDPGHWAELIAAERVTVWNSAPALLGLLVDHLEQTGAAELPRLRLALLGGDWVPVTLPDRLRAFAPGLRFIVMGGATEASIHSTIYEVGVVDPEWTSIPYGRPMANQRTYILDEALQPVPPGVAGDLYLAGVGLARGYLDRPERTAERFLEWSYGPVLGERLYRTGDLARYGVDGQIELLGRTDFQIKINGLRVELGEIEAVLRLHPGVRQVAVAARGGRLIAYLVPYGPGLSAAELSELAARRLPEFMVPAAFVQLAELPLNPNGKLDRKALPEPDDGATVYRAPSSDAERALAEAFADVLGRPRIGVDDDFIAKGGDSIRAILAVTRARTRGITITAGQVLTLRTVAAIAPVATGPSIVEEEDAGLPATVEAEELAGLARRYPGLSGVWPLTPMQSGMLFESLLDETGAGAYQMQTVYHLAGDVDAGRLRAVGRALLDRHAGLRAGFVPDATDRLVQVIVDDVEPPWREVDLGAGSREEQEAAFRRFLDEDRAVRFDPAAPPLLRLALVRFGPRRSRLVLTAHHALLDGWSEQVLAGDIVRLYAGEALPPARGFADHLAWLARQDRAADARAWAAELSGLDGPTVLVPSGASRGQAADIDEIVLPLSLPAAGGTGPGVTTSTLVQGAWAIVLAALTGRTDVVFGATVSGRPGALDGVEAMVGLFINTVPVRARVEPAETVAELLSALHGRQAALLEHQHHGLAEISHAALFDTLVVVQSFPDGRTGGGGVEVTRIDSVGGGSYPLTLIVEADRLIVQYDRNVLDRVSVEDLAARFCSVARQLVIGADRRIGTLDGRPTAMLRPAPPVVAAGPAGGHRGGRTPREEALCELVAEVLGVASIGIDDDFFTLGCNSLTATRIIGRMRRTLGIETSLRTIFQYPTIAGMSSQIKAAGARPALRKMTG